MQKSKRCPCAVCKKEFSQDDLIPYGSVRAPIAILIQKEYPLWSENCYICHTDLSTYRAKYVHIKHPS